MAETRRTRHVESKGSQGPFVKYVGTANKRTITPTDWRSLGIEAKAGHVWNDTNDYLVPSSEFSDEQLDYLLVDDKLGGSNTNSFIEVKRDSVDGDLVEVTQ